ncbi:MULTISPECIES: hypothetical protein [Legionella]|uniref:Tetratricopeptide repeat protein n=1 Tax=Legionella resiliens TaxID=2905958 RepID=A0ABS8X4E0_9GAMM|nr:MULTISPECIES: hypothetical protein [unclassified Legionella]MCE0722566.1 hypothetical protein [Legionella sp. 9fVS26]MCE3531719.1 hypothetical protein [Legionella sp. 8cVS16]QLZ67745.1 hypothetical protein FOLKNPGA_00518 [Legionella sp. PC1000]
MCDKNPFESLFIKPRVNLNLIPRLKKILLEYPDNQIVKEEYIEALLDYASELMDMQNYKEAENYLKIADQYTDRRHHLKFLISDLLLQIKENDL